MNFRLDKCPFCGNTSDYGISKDLYKCSRCHIVFNVNCKSLSYDRDYFISEYQNQYGKTYLDDFDNIYSLSVSRLEKVLSLLNISEQQASLLDIGSAAGFFLKAAKDRGVGKLTGIEISGYASGYCRKNFNIDTVNSPFEKAELDDRFDIITSWFFLEHLSDPLTALEKIRGMLNDGGVFALGVPSYFGPMFYLNRKDWVRTHPNDHRIDLSPKGAKKILHEIGFSKVNVVKCGYHPERILNRDNIFYRPFELLYRLFTGVTGFSDTIEIYAVK